MRGDDGFERDRAGSAPTVIVSHAFAAGNWPGGSAIGMQIRLSGLGEDQWRTVVGVARDVPLGDPLSRDRSTMAVYIPLGQTDVGGASLTFRGRGNPAAAKASLHRAVGAVDGASAPVRVSTYDEILEQSALISRSVTRLFALCFAFTLLLALSGTYGLADLSSGYGGVARGGRAGVIDDRRRGAGRDVPPHTQGARRHAEGCAMEGEIGER
ncbi:MAG TPA: hypothetical protein VFT57_16560 [Gemmatimonadaceae bacterium]|nr:hypothetical protein [Gemmatimonadaceae bacterium]